MPAFFPVLTIICLCFGPIVHAQSPAQESPQLSLSQATLESWVTKSAELQEMILPLIHPEDEKSKRVDWDGILGRFAELRKILLILLKSPTAPKALAKAQEDEFLPTEFKESLIDEYFRLSLQIVQLHVYNKIPVTERLRWALGLPFSPAQLKMFPLLNTRLKNPMGEKALTFSWISDGRESRLVFSSGALEGTQWASQTEDLNENELLGLYQYFALRQLLHADQRISMVLDNDWDSADLLPSGASHWAQLLDYESEKQHHLEEEFLIEALMRKHKNLQDLPLLTDKATTVHLVDLLIPIGIRVSSQDPYALGQIELNAMEQDLMLGDRSHPGTLIRLLGSQALPLSAMTEDELVVVLTEVIARAKVHAVLNGLLSYYQQSQSLSQKNRIVLESIIEIRAEGLRNEIQSTQIREWIKAALEEKNRIKSNLLTDYWSQDFIRQSRELHFAIERRLKNETIDVAAASTLLLPALWKGVPAESILRDWWNAVQSAGDWIAARAKWNEFLLMLTHPEAAKENGLIDVEALKAWIENKDYQPVAATELKNPEYTAKILQEIGKKRKAAVLGLLEMGKALGFHQSAYETSPPLVQHLIPVQDLDHYLVILKDQILSKNRALSLPVSLNGKEKPLYIVLSQLSFIKHPPPQAESPGQEQLENIHPEVLLWSERYIRKALKRSQEEIRVQIARIGSSRSLDDISELINNAHLQSLIIGLVPQAEKIHTETLIRLNDPTLHDELMDQYVSKTLNIGFIGLASLSIGTKLLRYLGGGSSFAKHLMPKISQKIFQGLTPMANFFEARLRSFTNATSLLVLADIQHQISRYAQMSETMDHADSLYLATALGLPGEHLFTHGEMRQNHSIKTSVRNSTYLHSTLNSLILLGPAVRLAKGVVGIFSPSPIGTIIMDARAQRQLGLQMGEWNLEKARATIQNIRSARPEGWRQGPQAMTYRAEDAALRQSFLRIRSRLRTQSTWTLENPTARWAQRLIDLRNKFL